MNDWIKPIIVFPGITSIFSSLLNGNNFLDEEKKYEHSLERFDFIDKKNNNYIDLNSNNYEKLPYKNINKNSNDENNDKNIIEYLLYLFPEWKNVDILQKEFWNNWHIWINKNDENNDKFLSIKRWKERVLFYLNWALNMEKNQIIEGIRFYDNESEFYDNEIQLNNLIGFVSSLKLKDDEWNFDINDKILILLKLNKKEYLSLIYDFIFFFYSIILDSSILWFFLYLSCCQNKTNMKDDLKFQSFMFEWEELLSIFCKNNNLKIMV